MPRGFARRYPKIPKRRYSAKRRVFKRKVARAPRARPMAEMHYVDSTIASAATMATTLTITPITLTAQGDGTSNRTGNKINIKSVSVHVFIRNASGSNQPAVTKCFLWQEKNSNGLVPTAADLLTNSTTLMLSRLNPDHAGHEFKMIRSKVSNIGFQGDGVSEPAGGVQVTHFQFYKKLNTIATYNGSTAAQSACFANHLYFGYFSDISGPVITAQSRVSFMG